MQNCGLWIVRLCSQLVSYKHAARAAQGRVAAVRGREDQTSAEVRMGFRDPPPSIDPTCSQ